jgi:hypothetical protein
MTAGEPNHVIQDTLALAWVKRERKINLQNYENETLTIAVYIKREHIDLVVDELGRKLDLWENTQKTLKHVGTQ